MAKKKYTKKYLAVIIDSEMKPTKAGTGQYVQLTYQVIEGEYNNCLLWIRLNLYYPNAVVVKIARHDLSAICRAVGIMVLNDSAALHNLPLAIHVQCKKREDTGEIVNEIKGYLKKEIVRLAIKNGEPVNGGKTIVRIREASMLILRPYQDAAKSAVYQHLRTREDNPCVVIPTGGGKTPLLASIRTDAVRQWDGRVIVLAHVKELLEQSVDKRQQTGGELDVGVYLARPRRSIFTSRFPSTCSPMGFLPG